MDIWPFLAMNGQQYVVNWLYMYLFRGVPFTDIRPRGWWLVTKWLPPLLYVEHLTRGLKTNHHDFSKNGNIV